MTTALPTQERFFGWTLAHRDAFSVADFLAVPDGAPLTEDALVDLAAALVGAHEELRLFVPEGSEDVFHHATLSPEVLRGNVSSHDLRAVREPAEQFEGFLRAAVGSHGRFSLAAGNVLRLDQLLLPDCAPLIHVGCHHLVADMVSVRLVARAARRFLSSGRPPRPSSLAALRRATRDYRRSPDYKEEEKFWARHFERLPDRTDRFATEAHRSASPRPSLELGAELSESLRRCSSATGIPIWVALAAGTIDAYRDCLGSLDFAIDLVESGRDLRGFDREARESARSAVSWLSTTSTLAVGAGAFGPDRPARSAARWLFEELKRRPTGPVGPLMQKNDRMRGEGELGFTPPNASLYFNFLGPTYRDLWPELATLAASAGRPLDETVDSFYGAMRSGRTESFLLKIFVYETGQHFVVKSESQLSEAESRDFGKSLRRALERICADEFGGSP